jgi:PucR C-terminal helix-turn-helix domain/GGDEF-like domain
LPARAKSRSSRRRGSSFEQIRAELSVRLRSRRAEIEQAVLTRAFAVSDSNEPVDLDSLDPEYLEGLRTAISAAVEYGLCVIERGEERAPPTPPVLLAQARLAARYGVGLDTVLRRYSAGYVLLSDFLIEEAERGGVRGSALQRLLRAQATVDRLLAGVSEEYRREVRERPSNAEQRRTERIERLLAGELIDTSELAYDFGGAHLALVGAGPEVGDAMRDLAPGLDRRLLTVCRGQGEVWGWLGGRQPLEMEELVRHVRERWPARMPLAIGEPAAGLTGWRLTHRQARAALPIAQRDHESCVRYADVALLAAVLQDDLLAASLCRLYLEPLERARDGGKIARETLRAYFAAERNVSSAAATLGVNRNTVASRIRSIEAAIDRPLASCGPELELALRLASWSGSDRPG